VPEGWLGQLTIYADTILFYSSQWRETKSSGPVVWKEEVEAGVRGVVNMANQHHRHREASKHDCEHFDDNELLIPMQSFLIFIFIRQKYI
jgi:hypothetical protein